MKKEFIKLIDQRIERLNDIKKCLKSTKKSSLGVAGAMLGMLSMFSHIADANFLRKLSVELEKKDA